MTATYDITQLATSALFQVRLTAGDTNIAAPLLQDEEWTYFLSQRNTVYGAAALGCTALASQFSQQSDLATGSVRLTLSQKAKAYRVMALKFEAQAASGAMPYAGGISVTDKTNNQQDPDQVAPQFQIGMEDNLLPVPPDGNEIAYPVLGT